MKTCQIKRYNYSSLTGTEMPTEQPNDNGELYFSFNHFSMDTFSGKINTTECARIVAFIAIVSCSKLKQKFFCV
jgi:hypothetical protein